MYLSGSGVGDPRWLEKIAKHPPDCLSQLEYWFGALDVDFAHGEGSGFVLRRRLPDQPMRGSLRREVVGMLATFRYDMYHEHHERPRDMSLQSFDVTLDIGYARLAAILRAEHGDGRTFETDGAEVTEYGNWFYLRMQPDASARLTYHAHERPEWALPPVMPDSREHLMTALFDRLIVDTTIEPMIEALTPIVAAASGELTTWNRGELAMTFRPGLPIELVTRTFRWDRPVASSGDVHMSSWRLYQHRPDVPFWEPNVGIWCVDVKLDGWPRDHAGNSPPEVGRAGPSPLYDVRAIRNLIASIVVRPPYR